jgi:hypothetical protein
MTTTETGRYLATDGEREFVLLRAAGGSRLLVDRRVCDRDGARLLAHLSRDEPDSNANLVARQFLADRSRQARPLRPSDFRAAPDGLAAPLAVEPDTPTVRVDASGRRYALRASGSPRELRWHCDGSRTSGPPPRIVSAREVVAALEDYEPVCSLTRAAVERFRADRTISVAALAVESRRIETSPIVLNRRLREAVIAAVTDHDRSLSAIAMACGRIKRDRRGNGSGETSWLARRVGLLPAGRAGRPNPWVHSDTLALIAREGLGLAPREVELP